MKSNDAPIIIFVQSHAGRRATKQLTILCTLLVLVLASCQPIRPEAAQQPAAGMGQTEERIQNAMSAAPISVAKDATVVDWPAEAGGELVQLREGSNEWTCYTDWPDSPTNDPMCLDKIFTSWFEAYSAGLEPQVTALGIGYMLQGGSDPSNDDPFATEPPAGQEWMIAPPHVMFISPEKLDPAVLSTDPDSGGPWIMYAGTPYEHIMMPADLAGIQGVEDPIENARRAAPALVGKDATVQDWPTEGMNHMMELHKGTNDWTCVTDWPVTTANDPMCLDKMFTAWNDAYMAGLEPNTTGIGLAYMLLGGVDASNTDPAATEPPTGEDWIISAPHVMVIVAGKLDPAVYSTDPYSGGPWIMFPGTPYEHLMVPLTEQGK